MSSLPPTGRTPTVLRAPAAVIACRVSDAARALGICTRTVERLIAAGKLPASRLGRAVVVKVADLERLLDANRIGGMP